jgi:hypothetical protein
VILTPVNKMLLHLTEDEHGWLVEPHGTEPQCWSTTLEGSEQLKAAGWVPYRMPRVSRHVMDMLFIDGWITYCAFKVPETSSRQRENQLGPLASSAS